MKAALLSFIALAAAALAQAADHVPPAPQKTPLLITNATLHPVSGPVIENGRMLVDKGRIVALAGAGQALPATATPPQVVDLGGRHVYPGFIAANSALGLVEVSGVPVTVDTTETGAINPNARAVVALNADSELLPVTRSNGVLAALAVPSAPAAGGIAGTSAVIQLDGWSWEEMALVPEAALHVRLPSMRLNNAVLGPELEALGDELRRAAANRLREIEQAFDAAAAYARARSATPDLPRDARWDAMLPAMRGERPVFVFANDLAQIRQALALAEKHALKLVIVGGADSWRVAELLREKQVPVIIASVHIRPLRRDEGVDEAFRLAGKLHAVGVTFAIARSGGSGSASNDRNLPYEAATAAAHGLPRDEALKAITLYPAQILGVDKQLGALAPGLLANFIVTDGDPLETPTQVQRIFIQGREVEAGNRQTRLAEKYKQRYEQLKAR